MRDIERKRGREIDVRESRRKIDSGRVRGKGRERWSQEKGTEKDRDGREREREREIIALRMSGE